MDAWGHPGRREAAVAVTVAAIVVLITWLVGRGGMSGAGGNPTSLAGQSDDSVVQLDVSPNVTSEQVAACLAGDSTVEYAEVQKSGASTVPVLIVRDPSGGLHLCDSFGADSPSIAPLVLADADHAVRLISNGRQSWDCDGTRLEGLKMSHWLSVSDKVAQVQLRFVIDGATGPWFASAAQHGFAHVEGWLGEQNPGAKLQVQVRALDKLGEAVPQDAFPVTPTPLLGCVGGSIELG